MLASLFHTKSGDRTLGRRRVPLEFGDLSRRDFMVRLCGGTAAAFIASPLWQIPRLADATGPSGLAEGAALVLRPRYRSERPLDAMLLKVQAGSDRFISEKYADQIATILGEWSAALLRTPRSPQVIRASLSQDFRGPSLSPADSAVIRSSSGLQVRRNRFNSDPKLDPDRFVLQWESWLKVFSSIDVAEFQVTRIQMPEDITGPNTSPRNLITDVRYEVAGSGAGFHRQQRIGNWRMEWDASGDSHFQLRSLQVLEETEAKSISPFYVDVSAAALGANASYKAQMLHGTDYWRTLLDGASGIDVYGHNGVSFADIDGDGLDDLYVCQPAGLPNRLYRNRGNGTFEDVTEASGLGILESTACALFADFNHDGHQDVIVVRANGPLFFLNDGTGKFHQKTDAFQFANAPQGTFTGAAAADYDRDGWLDIYFCLYSYYQGTGQYRYPSPYQDAENGPPNFLMRNNRNGTFRDVTQESALSKNNSRYSFCCSWNDYNRDGWPDLYVVNDFGRKNLYRNNGDGTFTDVAAQSKAEDVGAGMSVSWLDFDADGAEDLYVANMWTAAGLRVSMQDAFKKDSTPDVRALYQKHAMGNSLLRNDGATFKDLTSSSGTGIGRWAWSSDAFDFDHDGFPDIYIANGMVSGPSRSDLNSFFWRQVVANSPDQAASSHEYEQGWSAINELIRSDATWSGYERNIFYANNRNGTFADVSAAAGLGFIEDSRSFALADLDYDGRLELVLKNRNSPQLRVLKNIAKDLPPSIVFRLQGTKSNPDAVGASVTVETGSRIQTQSVRVGSGFLSQHSKEIFFGLGEHQGPLRAAIRWPSGLVQQLTDLPVNHRIWVQEGKQPSRREPFRNAKLLPTPASSRTEGDPVPSTVETWLLAPVPTPDFSLPDLEGRQWTLAALRGKPALLHFWTSKSDDCITALQRLEKTYKRWPGPLITINVDEWTAGAGSKQDAKTQDLSLMRRDRGLTFPILRASGDVAAIYNLLQRHIFDRHQDMALPASFLINETGNIVKVYRGAIEPKTVDQDLRSIPRSEAERLQRGLPFSTIVPSIAFGRNYLSLGAQFFQRGYLEQAAAFFQQALQDDPSSAEAIYGLGSVYLNQNKNAAAREMFERGLRQSASYPDTLPDTWNNLGVISTRENNVGEAIQDFENALKINPNHLLSLDNLGNAYRLQKRWTEAQKVLARALAIAPDDPEANYSLGMVYAQTDETTKAYDYLRRALQARPDYPEALNNLGVLYLVTQRPDEAIATFQQCIRVAPAFAQAYLNLARVFVLRGDRDQARELLNHLLQDHPDQVQARQMLQQLQ
jgi:tetratricopeptide (TPR) repeat protein/peroxiredoxin